MTTTVSERPQYPTLFSQLLAWCTRSWLTRLKAPHRLRDRQSLAMTATTPAPPPHRTARPNYNLIHANPLPLAIQPLPPLIPHNPLSLLHILYAFFFCRVPCQPEPLYTGSFNPVTRSVHVTDVRSIQALWSNGFFGKGSLSRSEPTWISRRKRALGVLGKDEALTAEEITERRRKERKEFKRERARAEKERIQNQLAQEGKIDLPEPEAASSKVAGSETKPVTPPPSEPLKEEEEEEQGESPKQVVHIEDLEHLQLTLEEAFFLSYGLGALKITVSEGNVCDLYHRYEHNKNGSNVHHRNLLKSKMPCVCFAGTRSSPFLRVRWICGRTIRSSSTMSFTTTSALSDGL